MLGVIARPDALRYAGDRGPQGPVFFGFGKVHASPPTLSGTSSQLIVTRHSLATLAPGCDTGQVAAQSPSARGSPARGPLRRRRDPDRKERILAAAATLG